MNIAIADHNGKIASTWDSPQMSCNRDAVGPGEEFTLLAKQGDAWVPFDLVAAVTEIVKAVLVTQPPVTPPAEKVVPWTAWKGSAKDWFMRLVEGYPFGQQTLLALQPFLNTNGWQLTPPNADGQRTKVGYVPRGGEPVFPDGLQWVRVGFGEGHWVWVVQS